MFDIVFTTNPLKCEMRFGSVKSAGVALQALQESGVSAGYSLLADAQMKAHRVFVKPEVLSVFPMVYYILNQYDLDDALFLQIAESALPLYLQLPDPQSLTQNLLDMLDGSSVGLSRVTASWKAGYVRVLEEKHAIFLERHLQLQEIEALTQDEDWQQINKLMPHESTLKSPADILSELRIMMDHYEQYQQKIRDKVIDVDAVNKQGQTLLFYISTFEMADFLIKQGANVKHRDVHGATPSKKNIGVAFAYLAYVKQQHPAALERVIFDLSSSFGRLGYGESTKALLFYAPSCYMESVLRGIGYGLVQTSTEEANAFLKDVSPQFPSLLGSVLAAMGAAYVASQRGAAALRFLFAVLQQYPQHAALVLQEITFTAGVVLPNDVIAKVLLTVPDAAMRHNIAKVVCATSMGVPRGVEPHVLLLNKMAKIQNNLLERELNYNQYLMSKQPELPVWLLQFHSYIKEDKTRTSVARELIFLVASFLLPPIPLQELNLQAQHLASRIGYRNCQSLLFNNAAALAKLEPMAETRMLQFSPS